MKVVHHSHPQTILNKRKRKLKEKLQKSTQALLKGWDAAGLYTLHTHCADIINCIAWEIIQDITLQNACLFMHMPTLPLCVPECRAASATSHSYQTITPHIVVI